MTGHVDGVGTVGGDERCRRRCAWELEAFEVEAPAELARFVAAKGSIAVDGVSLTVNSVDGAPG